MALYCIKDPKGKLLSETLSAYPWSAFYWDVLHSNGSELTVGKHIATLMAKKAGYKKVRVYLTEEKP